MICIAEGSLNDAPSFTPFESFNIDQDTLQLDYGKGWMCVIELNSNLFWELRERLLRFLEPAHDVVQRGSTPKVLLFQTELFTTVQIVVGIQHCRDRLCALLITNGGLVFTRVELLEIELSFRSFRRPKSEIVCGRGAIARNRDVISHCINDLSTFPDGNSLAIFISATLLESYAKIRK